MPQFITGSRAANQDLRQQKFPTKACYEMFQRRVFHTCQSQPHATILTISSRSPVVSARRVNSDGATASPLCSTTTLRGGNFCVSKNSSSVQGSFASVCCPLAITKSLLIANVSWFKPSAPRPNPSKPAHNPTGE